MSPFSLELSVWVHTVLTLVFGFISGLWGVSFFFFFFFENPARHLKDISWFMQYLAAIATTAKSLQSCPTLCDPRDGSPPGSPVPGILQARTLDWVAISFSNK